MITNSYELLLIFKIFFKNIKKIRGNQPKITTLVIKLFLCRVHEGGGRRNILMIFSCNVIFLVSFSPMFYGGSEFVLCYLIIFVCMFCNLVVRIYFEKDIRHYIQVIWFTCISIISNECHSRVFFPQRNVS
jgi:hypothetical protein